MRRFLVGFVIDADFQRLARLSLSSAIVCILRQWLGFHLNRQLLASSLLQRRYVALSRWPLTKGLRNRPLGAEILWLASRRAVTAARRQIWLAKC